MKNFLLDFGYIDEEHKINGIIGLDILLRGKFIIDKEYGDILNKFNEENLR